MRSTSRELPPSRGVVVVAVAAVDEPVEAVEAVAAEEVDDVVVAVDYDDHC